MTIAILDDHKLVTEALHHQLLQIFPESVVKTYHESAQLEKALSTETFNLLLLDIDLGKESGLDLLIQLRKSGHVIPVLMLTGNVSGYTLQESLKSGANGFLGKDASAGELQDAVKTVASGGTYHSKSLTPLLHDIISKPHHRFGLSDREIEITKLIVKGLGYREIGERLFISPRTVEAHRNHILEKLQLENVMELVRFAIKNHLA